jgi:hypothetical protein
LKSARPMLKPFPLCPSAGDDLLCCACKSPARASPLARSASLACWWLFWCVLLWLTCSAMPGWSRVLDASHVVAARCHIIMRPQEVPQLLALSSAYKPRQGRADLAERENPKTLSHAHAAGSSWSPSRRPAWGRCTWRACAASAW